MSGSVINVFLSGDESGAISRVWGWGLKLIHYCGFVVFVMCFAL